MNENLPINVDEGREIGSISYANEVIAIIAGMAANEVDGVARTSNPKAIADLLGLGNRGKPMTRGVKVEVGVEEASVELMLTVEYGKPIQKVCTEVQESVRKSIETMTGLHVLKVDVHVMGVSFERETQEMAAGFVKATDALQSEKENETDPTEPDPAPEEENVTDDIDADIPEDDAPETQDESPAADEPEETGGAVSGEPKEE